MYTEAGMDGSWQSALNIARNMIMDLNNWCNGYTFWNLLLDQNGGPRHAGGSPSHSKSNIITADTQTGEVTFNPPHYTFGQFSKFIKPGAKRIACTSSSDNLIATSFINPDGKIAVVLLNLRDYNQNIQIWIEGHALKLRCSGDAVMTVIF
jgi:glucosylceramidase